MELVVSLISGVIGGNAAGAVLKPLNLGMYKNSLAGAAGGLVAGQALLQTEFASRLGEQSTSGAAGVMAILIVAAFGGFCATPLGALLLKVAVRR